MNKTALLACALLMTGCAIAPPPSPADTPPDASYEFAVAYAPLSDCFYQKIDHVWHYETPRHADDIRKTDLPSENMSSVAESMPVYDQIMHGWQVDFHGIGKNKTRVDVHKDPGLVVEVFTSVYEKTIPDALKACVNM